MYGMLEGAGVEIIDKVFEECIIGHARIERLWTGARWSEGPAWFAAGRYLVWSDIPNNRMMRYDDTDGSVSEFRSPSNYSNGNTVDPQSRLVSCEHGARRVTRTEHDGSITVIADHFEGKKLNSPNDVVVKSDGSTWFTDPTYGIMTDYEGDKAESEIGNCNVYRVDPHTREVSVVASDFLKPNGLAFSLDEKILYVSDTGKSHQKDGPAHIRKLTLGSDGKSVEASEVFAECSNGFFDGFRLDASGLIWSSAGDGVHCMGQDGRLIGKILIPEVVANVCFGGAKKNRLFMAGTTSLYSLYLGISGI